MYGGDTKTVAIILSESLAKQLYSCSITSLFMIDCFLSIKPNIVFVLFAASMLCWEKFEVWRNSDTKILNTTLLSLTPHVL